MKEKVFKNNNSKKLFVGVSIIFCIVILIIGASFAYFTQSASGNIDDIATIDIRDTLKYTDNTTYMRQSLIPAKIEVVEQAYNLEGDNKCIDNYRYSTCSVYEFNIKNIANVSQELIIDMIPTVNTFANLYFSVYEIDKEDNKTEIILNQKIEKITDITNIPTYNLNSNIILKPNNDKTYQLVFYVLDTGEDQTIDDSGKQLGAGIKINSITTGKYMVKNFGSTCWTLDEKEPTKLSAFNGIDNNTGEIDETCNGYVSQDNNGYYNVNVPSNVGGQEISTLGNTLFFPVSFETFQYTNLAKIKQYNISEGITTIEDGFEFDASAIGVGTVNIGTFTSAGYNFFTSTPIIEEGVTVNLPNSLKNIGKNAFSAANIKEIELPNNLEVIGNNAFGDSLLTKVIISSSVEVIGDGAFYRNTSLTNVTFKLDSEGNSSLKTIGVDAFGGNNIIALEIPSSVETIGESAFENNKNLSSLTFGGAEDGTSKLKTIGAGAFYGYLGTSLVIPSSVEEIGADAFLGDDGDGYISNLIFDGAEDGTSKLKIIGKYAFSGHLFESLTIPSSVEEIGGDAFEYNRNLSSLTFGGAEDGISKLRIIGENAFYENSIESLYIPSNVEKIEKNAFYKNSIESLYIGSGVEEIAEGAFRYNENLSSLTFEGAEDGTSKLKTIGKNNFSNTLISSLIIPSNLEIIGEKTFENNTRLTQLKFGGLEEKISKLKIIGDSAFNNSQISSLQLPQNLQSIGLNAFSGANITSLVIPAHMKSIGGFSNNKNLTTLIFEDTKENPSQLLTIDESAFYDTNISSITIPSSVEKIGISAFYKNSNLTEVTFMGALDGTSNLKLIGAAAFAFTGLTSVTIPASVEEIQDLAFNYSSSLSLLTFMGALDGTSKLKYIGSDTFSNCGLTSITLPSSLEEIYSFAFYKNSNLTEVTFMGALDGTSKLKNIYFSAFYDCNLTYETNTAPLILPASTTYIQFDVFDNNPKLRYIYYPGDATGFGSSWNGNATVLKQLVTE